MSSTQNDTHLPPHFLAKRLNWDVFLSFRGEDTRHTITTTMYNSLASNGLRVFFDDQGMDKGDAIASALQEAIVDSAIAVAIISPRYGDSRWCLQELSDIFKCRKRVIPVFYRVDPSHVRRQTGKFGTRFKKMVDLKKPSQTQVDLWVKALDDVGNISGYPCTLDSDEPKVIQRIVKQVLQELKNTPEYVAKITVGLDSRVDVVSEKLGIHSGGVRFLGIHGTPGIGKTTLAKAAFNKLAAHFTRRCFISNVREQLASEGGVLSVLNKLMNDLSIGSVRSADQESTGRLAIKEIFNENRVLVVLDDVSEVNQLERLGIDREWFEVGSRIIVTGRDKGVIEFCCNKDELHEAAKLSTSESLELFSIHAFGRREPTAEYLGISEVIVSLTNGLPLALEVFGSSLVTKTKSEWEDSLSKLRNFRPEKLQGVIKISYDALDCHDKAAFLDISCLLLQMNLKRGDVVDILEGFDISAEAAIRNLVTKSLMKILESDELWMHDQIKDMGRQIVMEESFQDPGKRSRLWDSRDIRNVLRHERATGATLGIVLDLAKPPNDLTMERICWYKFRSRPSITTAFNYLAEKYKDVTRPKADEGVNSVIYSKSFKKMANLRLLQINYAKLRGNIEYLPSELRCLLWKGCSQKQFSANIPEELRVLDLSESNIRQLWSPSWPYCGFSKVSCNLVVLNLSNNPYLTAVPDMSSYKHLKKLTLENCVGLTKIHGSIGNMCCLVRLNLRRCSNLVGFPGDITGMKGLKELIFAGCSKFRGLPDDVCSLKSLVKLRLDSTAIVELPRFLFRLTQLEVLSLDNCSLLMELPEWIGKLSSLKDLSLNHTKLKALPESIGSLSSLGTLRLVHCSALATLPDSVQNFNSLSELRLTGTSLPELPPSICSLRYLRVLSVGQCRSLSRLPVSIKGLASLTELHIDSTSITYVPDQICSLKFLRTLEMNNCKSLASLPKSIGKMSSLTVLWVVGTAIKQLPKSIGGLENLSWLNLNECRELCRLPDSIGMLTSLRILTMEETSVTCLPESFGMLENLRVLKMKKLKIMAEIHASNQDDLHGLVNVLPASFCNLSLLEEFDGQACRISGQIPDDFAKLCNLKILNLGKNSFHSLPSSLEGLCFLKQLLLRHCEKLRSLPRLPSTLEMLICADCYELESISDLSNLHCLQELQVANCNKLEDVPGLECLKSLRRLYMGGCTACASAVKRRLSKVTLRNLTNLSVPGSEIPDWFTQEAVNFAPRPNLAIKSVLVAVVISVDVQKLNDIYAKLPNIMGIQARILRQNMPPIFTTTLNLAGVPRTLEDQLYLCRFKSYNPLVLLLKGGDTIQMIQKSEAGHGVELKKWGIFLVFENEDDYEGDEDSLPVTQQSVTQLLVRFFLSSD
ncbi:hypothetical protein vseg_019987 [Gypsophila vaccaria]